MLRLCHELWRQLQHSRIQSKVAALLVCLLGTHWLLCTANTNIFRCETSHAEALITEAQSQASSSHATADSHSPHDRHDDVCCAGTDETHILTALVSFPTPIFSVTIAAWAVLLSMLLPLIPRAAAMRGRDGPSDIPYPALKVIRASLPHRAPPVFLA